MQSPILIQAGMTVAVAFGLYAFYCHWEANRVELATAFQRRERQGGRLPADLPRYRSRCLWSLLACSALVAGTIATTL